MSRRPHESAVLLSCDARVMRTKVPASIIVAFALVPLACAGPKTDVLSPGTGDARPASNDADKGSTKADTADAPAGNQPDVRADASTPADVAPDTAGKADVGSPDTGRPDLGSPDVGSPDTYVAPVWSECRFHFGSTEDRTRNGGAAMIAQLDYFTPGWMLGSSFDQKHICDITKAGAELANQVPVVVAYIAAAIVKGRHQLCDCNVGGCGGGDLCKYGAQYVVQDWDAIISAYKSYSTGYAGCYGTTRPIIFEMEPDWYQYTGGSQTQPWTMQQAGSRMTEVVNALKSALPNARFSLDASPWVAPDNGSDNGKQWYSNFDMSLFTFVNTSGGETSAATAKIRSANNMTWAGLNQVTGKPILADTGYGAGGGGTGHDRAWDTPSNINARIADGVIGICQYTAENNWGATISNIRGQLDKPRYCP